MPTQYFISVNLKHGNSRDSCIWTANLMADGDPAAESKGKELFKKHMNNVDFSDDVFEIHVTRNQVATSSQTLQNVMERNDELKSLIQYSYHSPNDSNHLNPKSQVCKLAMTDLIVERAISILDGKYEKYRKSGTDAYRAGFAVILFGFMVAGHLLLSQLPSIKGWEEFTLNLIKSFTFYGFVVGTAVALWRFGRAHLDQAERLSDRRHALRQGRLYVHLAKGDLSIDAIEKAFSWNIEQPNAFDQLDTDAKAPLGAVISDMIKIVPEMTRIALENSKKSGPSKP